MNWRIRMKKRHALFVLVATCSAISYLFGFIAHAETVRGEEGRFETGDTLEVETGLGDGYSTLGFTCLDTDYRGGYLFVSVMRLPITIIPTQMSGHGLTSSLLIPCQYQGTCSP